MGVVTDWLSREIRKVDRKRTKIRLGETAWFTYLKESGMDPAAMSIRFLGIPVGLDESLDDEEMYIGSKRHEAYARMSTQGIPEKPVVEATIPPGGIAPVPELSSEAQAIRESMHVVTEDALGDDLPASEAP